MISRLIGPHMRLVESYTVMAREAITLGAPIFQFFLVPQKGKRYLDLTEQDKEEFLKLRPSFQDIYIHTAYWINLANVDEHVVEVSKRLIAKEIAIAQQLNIKYLVLHPGAGAKQRSYSNDIQQKKMGFKSLAKVLNEVLAETDITIILENNMHGGATIGSDLHDFAHLKTLLTCQDRIRYCIDTAHAYSFGYDIAKIDEFVELIDATMGIEKLQLIHLNDTTELFGSRIDSHAPPGYGRIGKEVLQNFINHPRLQHLPVIIEMSLSEKMKIDDALNEVRSW